MYGTVAINTNDNQSFSIVVCKIEAERKKIVSLLCADNNIHFTLTLRVFIASAEDVSVILGILQQNKCVFAKQ